MTVRGPAVDIHGVSPRRAPPILLVFLLLAGTIFATAASVRYEHAQAGRRSAAEGERAAAVIRLSMASASGSLDDVAGLYDASRGVEADEFAAFGRRVLGRSGLSAVGWVERVSAADRARYERAAGRPIVEPTSAGLRPAPERPVLYPVARSISDLGTGVVLGTDEAAEPVRATALAAAVSTGSPVVTAPVRLVGSGQRGLLLYQPVFRGGGTPALVAARQSRLAGFVVGSYRLDALIRTAAAVITPGLPVEIRDGAHLVSEPAPGAREGVRTAVPLGGRIWTIYVGRSALAWGNPLTILLAGACITLFALALAITIGRRDRYAREAVAEATAELEASRRSQRALVENSPDVVTRFDADLRCLYANAAIERVTGLPPETFVGHNMDEVGSPDEMVEALAGAVLDVFATGDETDVGFEVLTPEGLAAMHARLAPERGPDGGVESVLVVSREVTLQRTAELALRSSEERYRSLVAAMSDGVVMQARTGAIIACNPAAVAILGLSSEQLKGRVPVDPRWRTIRADGSPLPDDEHPAMVTLRTGLPRREVIMGVEKPDGSRTWISASTEPVDDGDAAVVCCFTEITARRNAEREQAALQRIATLVATEAEPERVFERIAEEAADLVGADAAEVVRFGGGGMFATLVGVWTRHGLTATGHGESILIPPGSVSGIVAATGLPARSDAGPGTPGLAAGPDDPHSAVAVPVLVDGAPWGSLCAATSRPVPLPPESEERLARLSELAGLAIMSAAAREQMVTLAATDHLTGLWNRRAFHDRLAAELERARRYQRPMSLVMLDIDHFKRINDAFGHPAGDRVLIEVASRIFSTVREGEIVARVGGEEFAWILPETDAEGAAGAAERVRRAIAAAPFPGVGDITISLGVCDLSAGMSASELVRLADRALYWAKANGRDQVARFTAELAGATGGSSW